MEIEITNWCKSLQCHRGHDTQETVTVSIQICLFEWLGGQTCGSWRLPKFLPLQLEIMIDGDGIIFY